MKWLRDTSAPMCLLSSDQRLSAPFTDLCLLNPLHCHRGHVLSASLSRFSIITTLMAGQRHIHCAGKDIGIFTVMILFSLPFKFIFLLDLLLFHEHTTRGGCRMIRSTKNNGPIVFKFVCDTLDHVILCLSN